MVNNIINNNIFNFKDHNIIWISHNDTIWTKLTDIGKLLGYKSFDGGTKKLVLPENIKQYNKILSEEAEENKINIINIYGPISKNTNFINEAGFNKLLFSSTKSIAKKITDWIASDVMISIRKLGIYNIDNSNEKYKEIIHDFIDINDFNNESVLYILQLNNKLYKFGVTNNLQQRLKQHKQILKSDKIIKVFKLKSYGICLTIEKKLKELVKNLKIHKIHNNQTEIFETNDIYDINFIFEKINSYFTV